nr:MerC domain-containing protein [Cerasicoccus sp. TK19100]
MTTALKTSCRPNGWLDSLAIGMSIVCAIHCLVTPVLIVFLPILATTFWVHEDFHLWMLLFVLPTSALAMFLGCRKHKDRLILALSIIGLSALMATAIYESVSHADSASAAHVHCEHCVEAGADEWLTGVTLLNVMGGLFLASAHVRNYRLCRKVKCEHD